MSAAAMYRDADRAVGADAFRGLHVGCHSSVTSRHYLDCSGGISIGEFTVVGGVRTTILSHSLDIEAGVQTTRSVKIGDRCFVSSNVSVVPGGTIPEGCVIAMGALVVGELPSARALYAGVPAKVVKTGIEGGAYFRRRRGVVGLDAPDGLEGPGGQA